MQRPVVVSLLSAALVATHHHAAAGEATKAPTHQPPWPAVEVLRDDCATRGNWNGAYGSFLHVLPAVKGYAPLFGGHGWPSHFKLYTGDPKDQPRSWRSPVDYSSDDRALHNPLAGGPTGGVLDDHGEAYPIGKGPDLFIELLLPRGEFLLSLYFFEVDWIQYRAYDIHVSDRKGKLLAKTQADNFFEGKYKRFLSYSKHPLFLKIRILRKNSPNATVAGVFVDRVTRIKWPPVELGTAIDVEGRTSKELHSMAAHLSALGSQQYRLGAGFCAQYHEDLQATQARLEAFFTRYRTVSERALGYWALSECCKGLHDRKASREHFRTFLAAYSELLAKQETRDQLPERIKELSAELWKREEIERSGIADTTYVRSLAPAGQQPLVRTEAKRLADKHFEAKSFGAAVELYWVALDATTGTPTFEDAMRLGQALEKIAKYDRAAEHYEWICRTYPDHDQIMKAWHGQYWSRHLLRQYDRSKLALESLIAKGTKEEARTYKVLLAKNRLLAGEARVAKSMLTEMESSMEFAGDPTARAFAQAWLRNVNASIARDAQRGSEQAATEAPRQGK